MPDPQRRRWCAWLAVLTLTVVVRSGVLAARCSALRADPDGYRSLAVTLLDHGVFGDVQAASPDAAPAIRPTAYRPPLYPLVLAAVGVGNLVSPWAVALLHLTLGVVTVVAVVLLAEQWKLGNSRWLAAGLVACDPILLQQSTVVMTETLATALTVAALLLLTRMHQTRRVGVAVGAGVLVALASLCRPTFLPWFAAAWVAFLLSARRATGPQPMRPAARSRIDEPLQPMAGQPCGERGGWQAALAMLFAMAAVMAPWGVRNQLVFGRPIVSTTHGGYTLLLGNNPTFYDFLRARRGGDTWDSQTLDREFAAIRTQFGSDEVAADRWAYAAAWANIRRDPTACVHASLLRIGWLWGLVPHAVDRPESTATRWMRYGVGAWYALVFVLAVSGAWQLGRPLGRFPWLWGVLLLAAFTAAHVLYWSNLRMRAPLMPVVCLLAAYGWRGWRRAPRSDEPPS
jgi:hypothetical protein